MKPAFLVMDKPAGITSHDVVAVVRAVLGVKKVGHTGTLDPFATGVLPLALGPATRLIQFLDESIKVYDATIALGAATDTGDPTGKPIREAAVPKLDADAIRATLKTFVGPRMQTPPQYSAVKKDGKPLYHYARKGETVEVEARPITIHDLELLAFTAPAELRVRITCTRGTYARVLADEIATALGTAGHLSALERPRSGPFRIEDALSMPKLGGFVAPDHPWQEVLLSRTKGPTRIQWRPRDEVIAAVTPFLKRPLDVLSHLPLCDLTAADAQRIRRGGHAPPPPGGVQVGGKFLVVHGDELLGVGQATPRGPELVRLSED